EMVRCISPTSDSNLDFRRTHADYLAWSRHISIRAPFRRNFPDGSLDRRQSQVSGRAPDQPRGCYLHHPRPFRSHPRRGAAGEEVLATGGGDLRDVSMAGIEGGAEYASHE